MSKFIINEKLTIGVASFGNIKTTEICINNILNSIEGNFELILVEDFSHERDKIINFYQSIKKNIPNTKVFNFDRNLSYTNSVNCILSHATGKKVLFVSNDVFINRYYIEEVLKISNLSKKIGIVRGVSNFVDNGLQTHNAVIDGSPKTITDEDIISTAKKIFETNSGKYLEDKYLTGDIFLVNREILDNVGFYDTNTFTGYFSDHDFSSRAISSGYLCVLAKGAFAFHHQDINFNYLQDPEKVQNKKVQRFQQVFENWARFKIKYSLPHDLNYNGINDIPWEKTFDKKTKYIDKVDYSKYSQ